MVEAAPKLIKMFDRMGVPFTRTAEGVLDLRNFGGQKNKRTVFAGSTTGQQLLYALDEQVRRWEVKGGVKKYEFWEFIKIIKNKEGVCRGIVAQNMNSNEIVSFPADVVILATGARARFTAAARLRQSATARLSRLSTSRALSSVIRNSSRSIRRPSRVPIRTA